MPKDATPTYDSLAEALADNPRQKGKRTPETGGGITGSEEARNAATLHVRQYRGSECQVWSTDDLKEFERRLAKGIKMVREGRARVVWGEFAYVEIQQEKQR